MPHTFSVLSLCTGECHWKGERLNDHYAETYPTVSWLPTICGLRHSAETYALNCSPKVCSKARLNQCIRVVFDSLKVCSKARLNRCIRIVFDNKSTATSLDPDTRLTKKNCLFSFARCTTLHAKCSILRTAFQGFKMTLKSARTYWIGR